MFNTVNIGYRLARQQGKLNRFLYDRLLNRIVDRPIIQTRKLAASVYSLSCQRDLPEQVASLRSFLKYVGIPDRFVVISDGTYTPKSIQILQKIHPCVEVIPLREFAQINLAQKVYDYAEQNPMGKKLVTILSLPIDRTTIYTDSDILFFKGAGELRELISSNENNSYYLPDEAPALDLRIIQNEVEKVNPVNGGFLLFQKPLDWSIAMERFLNLAEAPNYFTEQTMVHLTMHKNRALPLCDRKYIMERDDEFLYPDKYAGDNIVLRHYVSPVRHKFWLNLKYCI